MIEGLRYIDRKGFKSVADLTGKRCLRAKMGTLDLNNKRVARINTILCMAAICATSLARMARFSASIWSSTAKARPGRVPGKPIPQVREEDVWGATFVRLCRVDELHHHGSLRKVRSKDELECSKTLATERWSR